MMLLLLRLLLLTRSWSWRTARLAEVHRVLPRRVGAWMSRSCRGRREWQGTRPTVWRGRWRARSERALSGSRTPAIMWFMDGGDCFSLAPVVESWCLLSGAHFLFHYFRLLFGVNTQYYNATGPDSDYSHNSGIPDNATKNTVLHHGSLWQKTLFIMHQNATICWFYKDIV